MASSKRGREPIGEIFTRDFLVLSTINLCVFFGFQMLNVGLPLYLAQLGATNQIVGLATTLMTVMATFMRVLSGFLLDRFGRIGALIAGTAITACAIFSFAVFPVVGIILGLRMLHGIGWGLGSTASSTIAADIIPKHRFAEGMGYFALTVSVSSAIAPAASIALVQGVGAVTMILVAGGITALALALAIAEAVLGRRKAAGPGAPGAPGAPAAPAAPGHGAAAGTPSASGAGMPARAGDGPSASAAAAEAPSASGATMPPGAAAPSQPPRPQSALEKLFERRAVLPGLLMMLVNIGFGCITTFIALHAESQGVNGASAYFLIYAIVTLVTRPYIGKLVDRYGYRIPGIVSSVCTAGTLALIGASSNFAMFCAAGVLGGLGIGTAMGTFQAMAVASVEPWRRGVATSTYMVAFDTGIAVGSLAGGAIVDAIGYAPMYYVIALFPLIAGVLSAILIKPASGNDAP